MKKILVVWANSKLAQRFIEKYENTFHFIKFTREDLNLEDENLEEKLLEKLWFVKLDWVIFFSSIYEKDNSSELVESHIKINSLSLYKISKIIIEKKLINYNWKFIFFTDGWTDNPKRNYLWYSVSKDLLKSFIKNLSINYPDYIFLWLDLWPVETSKSWQKRKDFFSKSLLNIKDPWLGLINFLTFLLQEDNFFSTGYCIDFTWWTYLKRC